LDFTVGSQLGHRVDDCAAETAMLGRLHGRPVAFCPADCEDITFRLPTHIDATRFCRERAVFAGIGRELVQRETDRLSGSCVQTELRAADREPRADKI
jgi:hypothetical protein